MLQRNSQTPFDPTELMYAILALIALAFLLFQSGCISVQESHPEPFWRPHVYLYSSIDGRCQFIDGEGHVIDCDEPLIHDHYLAPLEDLVTLKSKLQQCELWR